MAKVRAGEPLKPSARVWNDMVDVTQAYRLGVANGVPGPRGWTNPELIQIRNDSLTDRSQYEILNIGEPLITPTQNLASFKYQPVFKGTEPSATDAGKFAVLLEPIRRNKIGWARTTGMLRCQLQVYHPQHPYADIDSSAGIFTLSSNWYGGAEILWKESGTGLKWASVRLGHFFAGPILGKTKALIGPLQSGQVDVWYADAITSPVSVVTCYLRWAHGGFSLPAGSEIMMTFLRDHGVLVGSTRAPEP